MDIVFATANRGKLREAAEILGDGFNIISAEQAGITEDIEETGSTLKENSIIKARYVHEKTGMPCFADDTGLEVEALDGAPGIYSARYAGPGHDFQANVDKLLSEMQGVENRKARFRSVVTLIIDGEEHYFEGEMRGSIAHSRRGAEGFGYDPVFIPEEYPGKTTAELGETVKNELSHRGKSLRAMASFLKDR